MLKSDVAKFMNPEVAELIVDMVESGTQSFSIVGKLLEEEQFTAAKIAFDSAQQNLNGVVASLHKIKEDSAKLLAEQEASTKKIVEAIDKTESVDAPLPDTETADHPS